VEIDRGLDGWQWAEDSRMWKLILSPERGEALDRVDQTRRVMNAMEWNLGTGLEGARATTTKPTTPTRTCPFAAEARPAGCCCWTGST